MPAFRKSSGVWIIAWALTLLLHAAVLLSVRNISQPQPPSTIHRTAPIRFVFAVKKPEQRKAEEPHFFSELPPDRADKAPKKADFLSNVTSRARDRVPGGDNALPHMEGEADVPLAKLERGGSASSAPAGATPRPPPSLPASPLAAGSPQPSGAPVPQPTGNTGVKPGAPNPTQPGASQPKTEAAPPGAAGSAGNSDIDQPEMDNPNGNAGLTGDVSLNTTAWDYAPWLQRFGRQLMHRWIAPPAYTIGLLKEGGWAQFELEILPSGKVVRLQLLEEHGHTLLTQASHSALESMTPVEPLPAGFPEPSLILRIRMIYPRIRPR